MDNLLYTRNGLTGTWNVVPNSGFVLDITVLSNGVLLGTGPDQKLYSKQTLNDPWVFRGNCCVLRTSALPDGSILGIGPDLVVYKIASLGATWYKVPNSERVISVAYYADLRPFQVFVGIAPDNTLWIKKVASASSPWVQLPSDIRALDIIQMMMNSFIVVATDYQLYLCDSLYSSARCISAPNSGKVKSIAFADKDTIVGVGLDNQLYKRPADILKSGSRWTLVPNSGTVVDISNINSGVLVGTGPDNQLYKKKNLESPWEFIGGCCVMSTAGYVEGLYGVGIDGAMYTKNDLNTDWVLVPNSGTVRNVIGAWIY
ncbi:hypothetical protein HDU99_002016 [Rhizoclosmatium hyalinum]|nr:hypothetical protein HDU99_002016 [Rhizoclosmatium hyalinum]